MPSELISKYLPDHGDFDLDLRLFDSLASQLHVGRLALREHLYNLGIIDKGTSLYLEDEMNRSYN